MYPMEYFEQTIKSLWEVYFKRDDSDVEDYIRWGLIARAAANCIKEYVEHTPDLSRAICQRFQTYASHLISLEIKFDSLSKVGGNIQGLQPSTSRQQSQEVEGEGVEWRSIQSAFKNRIHTAIIVNRTHLDMNSFLIEGYKLLKPQVEKFLSIHSALKINTEMGAQFIVKKRNEEEDIQMKYFNTKNVCIYNTTNLNSWFENDIKQVILNDMEDFQERDSGWSLKTIVGLTININKHNPLKPSSYIPLPTYIANKKACINVKNYDNQCFKWSILSALHPVDHGDEVHKYKKYENELKFDGISFPVQIKSIKKFEKLNNISINLYILKKYGKRFEVSPCHVTNLKQDKHVNLLLIQDSYIDEENSDQKYLVHHSDENFKLNFHYVWIKNLSALVRCQIKKKRNKLYLCDRCLHYFIDEEKLKTHEMDCSKVNKCAIELPKNNILKFKNFKRGEKVPLVIYADFECILKPVENGQAFQEHEAFSIGMYLKYSFDDARSMYITYRKETNEDETPTQWIIKQFKILLARLQEVYNNAIKMNLSDYEEYNFKYAKKCHICMQKFEDGEKKVRDHCHLTGKFRGAAHNKCNLHYRNASFIPVVFHNFTGYDSHFIIKEIATHPDFEGDVKVLAENKERYISFTKEVKDSRIHFRFIDSFRFMPSSLDKLASYLTELDIVTWEFRKDNYTEEQIALLKRKGVFPYEYVNSYARLNEPQLPALKSFHSQLTNNHISEAEYQHAQNVWNTFNITDLGMYSDLYLKTDVLLLADIFENFRKTCLESYKLDPAHYYTTPGLTWDAMLKYTKVELELLTDVDMVLFTQKGIRGGISQCCNRYAKANNKYMGADFKEDEASKILMYFDANNLYGWAMIQFLPYGNFKWVERIDNMDFFNVPDDNDIGFILEVTLEYPKELHDAHKDLPLCPEHRAPPGSNMKKLLTTLYDKERYVIHYRALKQAIKYGLKLIKIHRALQFNQKPWLKPYVDLNTEKRKQARNEFEKLFYKLMVNAVYGKTMEDERKRKDVKLINRWEGRYGAEARIALPNFHSSAIFDENLVAVQLSSTTISINKPIYIGLCVLDLSKTLMYDFHYGYMLNRVSSNCKLLYTDTDSLIYEIEDVDMYEIMREDIDKFDTSDYPENNQFSIPHANKKVLGVMKDECNGSIMEEFIGLRSKMYSILIKNQQPIKKVKGIKKHIVMNDIVHEDYRNCLEKLEIIKRTQCNIRSNLHIVQTVREEKVALSANDDKRCIYPNDPNTLPWGHYGTLEISRLKERVALQRRKAKRSNITASDCNQDFSQRARLKFREIDAVAEGIEQQQILAVLQGDDRCLSKNRVCGGGEGPPQKKLKFEMEGETTVEVVNRDAGGGNAYIWRRL